MSAWCAQDHELSRNSALRSGGHAERFCVSFTLQKVPICRHFRCPSRDSNPRHADYDSVTLWLCRAKNGGWGRKRGLKSRAHPSRKGALEPEPLPRM
jgi:hypothetical protein